MSGTVQMSGTLQTLTQLITTQEVVTLISHILQRRKLRPREVK